MDMKKIQISMPQSNYDRLQSIFGIDAPIERALTVAGNLGKPKKEEIAKLKEQFRNLRMSQAAQSSRYSGKISIKVGMMNGAVASVMGVKKLISYG